MMRFYRNSALEILLLTALIASAPAEAAAPRAITRSQIEADWLRQDQVRFAGPISSNAEVSAARDAIGAIDGVRNGKWGFHTENELNPW